MSIRAEYVITVFDNATERLVRTLPVENADIDALHPIFGAPVEDPRLEFGCYPIVLGEAEKIALISEHPDFTHFTYFLEAQSLPE